MIILNRIKLGRAVTFMKYLVSVVFLIFLPKILNWNKIKFSASNSLKLVELVANKLVTSGFKTFTSIPFSIPFITAWCSDFDSF